MTIESLSYEELVSFIEDLLDETGEVALNYFRKTRNLSLKGDDSPVTIADKEIEKLIRSTTVNISFSGHFFS